jgi:hypothetical protein
MHNGARGLEAFLSSFLQNQFVQCQISDRATETGILGLEILHPLDLITLQPTEFLPPAETCDLDHANWADSINDESALGQKNIDLLKLPDHLFELMAPSRHGSDTPPRCHEKHFQVDQFNAWIVF